MNGTLGSIGLVVLFVLIGGVFAAAEIALVSLRDSQARALAGRSKRGRTVAELNEDPNRFLAAVQVGVTLAGFLSAAFGGATLADDLAPGARRLGRARRRSPDPLALVLVTIAISYLSLVLGELAPKRLALQRAEGVALAARPADRPDLPGLAAGHLAALRVDRRRRAAARRRPERQVASRSATRSCASWSARTRRWARRSAGSSRTSSRPATGRSAR